MTDNLISSRVNALDSTLSNLSIDNKSPVSAPDELGQSAFLQLMITQLENQDPLSPQENSDFIAQLAQFSSVESLDRLNNNFDTFTNSFVSNQALQASTLVGREVMVTGEKAQLNTGSKIQGSVDLPSSVSDIRIEISSESGALIQTVSAGSQQPGPLNFEWDGQKLHVNDTLIPSSQLSQALPADIYQIKVTAKMGDEEIPLESALSANVNSVTVGVGGALSLNLGGIGSVKLSDVKAIQ